MMDTLIGLFEPGFCSISLLFEDSSGIILYVRSKDEYVYESLIHNLLAVYIKDKVFLCSNKF